MPWTIARSPGPGCLEGQRNCQCEPATELLSTSQVTKEGWVQRAQRRVRGITAVHTAYDNTGLPGISAECRLWRGSHSWPGWPHCCRWVHAHRIQCQCQCGRRRHIDRRMATVLGGPSMPRNRCFRIALPNSVARSVVSCHYNTAVALSRCTFDSGGAVYATGDSSMTATKSTFRACSSNAMSGAINSHNGQQLPTVHFLHAQRMHPEV